MAGKKFKNWLDQQIWPGAYNYFTDTPTYKQGAKKVAKQALRGVGVVATAGLSEVVIRRRYSESGGSPEENYTKIMLKAMEGFYDAGLGANIVESPIVKQLIQGFNEQKKAEEILEDSDQQFKEMVNELLTKARDSKVAELKDKIAESRQKLENDYKYREECASEVEAAKKLVGLTATASAYTLLKDDQGKITGYKLDDNLYHALRTVDEGIKQKWDFKDNELSRLDQALYGLFNRYINLSDDDQPKLIEPDAKDPPANIFNLITARHKQFQDLLLVVKAELKDAQESIDLEQKNIQGYNDQIEELNRLDLTVIAKDEKLLAKYLGGDKLNDAINELNAGAEGRKDLKVDSKKELQVLQRRWETLDNGSQVRCATGLQVYAAISLMYQQNPNCNINVKIDDTLPPHVQEQHRQAAEMARRDFNIQNFTIAGPERTIVSSGEFDGPGLGYNDLRNTSDGGHLDDHGERGYFDDGDPAYRGEPGYSDDGYDDDGYPAYDEDAYPDNASDFGGPPFKQAAVSGAAGAYDSVLTRPVYEQTSGGSRAGSPLYAVVGNGPGDGNDSGGILEPTRIDYYSGKILPELDGGSRQAKSAVYGQPPAVLPPSASAAGTVNDGMQSAKPTRETRHDSPQHMRARSDEVSGGSRPAPSNTGPNMAPAP